MRSPLPHPRLAPLVDRAVRAFEKMAQCPPQGVACAPGRVNLIGEHTDYNDGYVLPMAIDRWCVAAGTLGGNRVLSEEVGEQVGYEPDRPDTGAIAPWARYPVGVIWKMQERVREKEWKGVDLALASSVPLGSGLSSSAAVELATGALVDHLYGLKLKREDLAGIGRAAEHEFAGVPCGIMDQLISACGEEDAAMLIDCRSLERQSVKLPPETVIVIADSGVRHTLASGEYAQRRESCRRAARVMGVASLRDADLKMVERHEGRLGPEDFACARHVVTENARVLWFVKAITTDNLDGAGAMMFESHWSLRDDYRVSCPELDALVEAALGCPGVHGARMTGGGFGGCTVTLCDCDAAERVCKVLGEVARGGRKVGRAVHHGTHSQPPQPLQPPREPFVARAVGGAMAWTHV